MAGVARQSVLRSMVWFHCLHVHTETQNKFTPQYYDGDNHIIIYRLGVVTCICMLLIGTSSIIHPLGNDISIFIVHLNFLNVGRRTPLNIVVPVRPGLRVDQAKSMEKLKKKKTNMGSLESYLIILVINRLGQIYDITLTSCRTRPSNLLPSRPQNGQLNLSVIEVVPCAMNNFHFSEILSL